MGVFNANSLQGGRRADHRSGRKRAGQRPNHAKRISSSHRVVRRTLGFPSYRASIFQGHETWSEVQHAGGAVWVKTAAKDAHPFEELAYLVPNIAMLCTQPGEHCHPVLPAHHREIARVATLTGTCYNSPYTVVDRVTKRSKRYYKLDIENWQGKSFLPRPIYVPTRNADGSHAGEFFARGC